MIVLFFFFFFLIQVKTQTRPDPTRISRPGAPAVGAVAQESLGLCAAILLIFHHLFYYFNSMYTFTACCQ